MNLFKLNKFCISTMRSFHLNAVSQADLRVSRGYRRLRSARKYKRPEDLVDPLYYGVGPKKEIDDLYKSMKDRGFAKEQPSYSPPKDIDVQMYTICKKLFGPELQSDWKAQKLSDPLLKYKVLTKCMDTFKKDVPNSYLCKMKNLENVLEFFQTPVDCALYYDSLVRDSDNLPPNLHVMRDSPAFNADTDTFFDGKTAYPGRRKIVHTKYGEKYEKIIEWPHL